MASEERFEQLREELRQRAMTVEANPVVPDQPTLTGWLVAMRDELAMLRLRLEDLEAGDEGRGAPT